jgi:hypothetical protein
MAKFKTLTSNFTVSTMVENGALTFFLDGNPIIQGSDSIDRKDMILSPGQHQFQWQVNGQQGLTRYSIRISVNGVPLPATGVGPKFLNSGNIDFAGDNFNV